MKTRGSRGSGILLMLARSLGDLSKPRTGLWLCETGQNLPTRSVFMSVLLGDVNGSRIVNASDIGLVKAVSGAMVTAANFRADAAVNGSINASDIGPVKSRSGQSVP